jgi:hypothetical protein
VIEVVEVAEVVGAVVAVDEAVGRDHMVEVVVVTVQSKVFQQI